MIGSIPLLCFYTEFYIGVQDFSDHSPVCCKLTFSDGIQGDNQITDTDSHLKPSCAYKWKDNYKDTFIQVFTQLYEQFTNSLPADNIVKINSRNSLRFINKQVRQQRWKHLNTTGGTISAQTQNGWNINTWKELEFQIYKVTLKYMCRIKGNLRTCALWKGDNLKNSAVVS